MTSFLVMTSLVAMVTISPMVDETDVSDREKESSDSDSDGKTQVVVKKCLKVRQKLGTRDNLKFF